MGHVFVVQSRLESFGWDAVIIPTSTNFGIRDYWRQLVTGDTDQHKPAGWSRGSYGRSRVDPVVWFIDVTGATDKFHDRVSSLLEDISAELVDRSRVAGAVPRIALPVLGVGGGGAGATSGPNHPPAHGRH